MPTLNGKTALITGANGGLGTFVTQAFLDAGAKVFGTSRSIQRDDFTHPQFTPIAADLNSKAAAEKAALSIPVIDIAVHLVGAFAGGKPVHEADPSELERMFDLNLRSAFFFAQAVLPRMRAQGSGRFLAVGSRSAAEPTARTAAYNLSKAALVSLVKTISIENSDRGITANIVLPGTMDTPSNRAAMPKADFSKWVQPQQVASLLVHLASDDGSNINGAAIPVYGI